MMAITQGSWSPRWATGAALCGMIMVAGCAVGPDYTAPRPALAPFHNAAALDRRAAALPPPQLDAWWAGFNDPKLTAIVQRALDQNLDLAAAFARVAQARAAAS